jgi:ribonuclease inhibitor
MKTIMLDGSLYATGKELHSALQRMLSLPDYYGMNADALNDCLSGRSEKVNLWIADPGTGETADTIRLIRAVVEDNGGEIKEL